MAEPTDRDLAALFALDDSPGPAQPIAPARSAALIAAALRGAGFPPPTPGSNSSNGSSSNGSSGPQGAGPHAAARSARHAARRGLLTSKHLLLAGGTGALAVALIIVGLAVRAPETPAPPGSAQTAAAQLASAQSGPAPSGSAQLAVPPSSAVQPASAQPDSAHPASAQPASAQGATQIAPARPECPPPAATRSASTKTAPAQPASAQLASAQPASAQPASAETASAQNTARFALAQCPSMPGDPRSEPAPGAPAHPISGSSEPTRRHPPPRSSPSKLHATPTPPHRRRLPPRTAAAVAVADPEDLLAEANAARLAHNWRSADALYTRVASAGGGALAAQTALVASAQLHLEHLGDPDGATRRFRRALATGARDTLAEDARWGLAEAARATHDTAAERAALDDFLAHHATSVRASQARARRAELDAP